MLLSLMKRFLKPEVVNDKRGKELLLIDVADKEKQLPLNKMNVRAEVPKLLKKISNNEKQRIEKLQCMQIAYIKMISPGKPINRFWVSCRYGVPSPIEGET